jgi:hypothetical protein
MFRFAIVVSSGLMSSLPAWGASSLNRNAVRRRQDKTEAAGPQSCPE